METKKVDVYKFMIKNNVNLEIEDIEGNTALFYSIHSKKIELVRILLDNGANIFHKNYKGDIAFEYGIRYANMYNLIEIKEILNKYSKK